MSERLSKIRNRMAKRRLDALLVTDLGNIRYASGFSGSAAVVVISLDRAVIFVDSRYTLQAREECPDFEVIQFKGDVFK
ncbi:MAG TPA: aminopeptidase P family N-terminal domain-containing protein, partial [Armatimonadota bacterium]|nr:aminopeptidase P family N-terminal domain-containing protein [Armatimonadota bacterium]